MEDERRRILTQLAEGKLTVTEAERLLDRQPPDPLRAETASKKNPKGLRVIITPHDKSAKVTDVKIPLGLIRTGIKFGAFMPGNMQAKMQAVMRERGLSLDLSHLDNDTIDRLSEALAREPIEIDDERGHTRVFCE